MMKVPDRIVQTGVFWATRQEEQEEEPSIMSEGTTINREQQRRRGSPDGWIEVMTDRDSVASSTGRISCGYLPLLEQCSLTLSINTTSM